MFKEARIVPSLIILDFRGLKGVIFSDETYIEVDYSAVMNKVWEICKEKPSKFKNFREKPKVSNKYIDMWMHIEQKNLQNRIIFEVNEF